MKRLLTILLCFILLLSGCSKPVEQVPTQQEETTQPTETIFEEEVIENSETEIVTELFAVSVPATCEKTLHEDGTELFSYTSQHMQLIIPDASVAEKVVLNFLNRVDSAHSDANNVLAAAQREYSNNSSLFPYYYQVIYSPTRIDRGVLSLFGLQNSYSGAAHGARSCIAVNYDLMTGDILTLGSIMHADATTEDFIHLVNAELKNVAEENKLYDNYEEAVQLRLGGDENLYEDFFFTPTGLNFFFSPYEIAPYTSGFITVEIPYNKLPGLIYDGYFPAEREQISGEMLTSAFDISDSEKFNNMADVNLAVTGTPYVVYPKGCVENIRIGVAGDNLMMPEYTVFAAFEMCNQDAVVINLDDNLVDRIIIDYDSDNNRHTISLTK